MCFPAQEPIFECGSKEVDVAFAEKSGLSKAFLSSLSMPLTEVKFDIFHRFIVRPAKRIAQTCQIHVIMSNISKKLLYWPIFETFKVKF